MGMIVNNIKYPVSYGYCVSDDEMHLEVAIQNLRDQVLNWLNEVDDNNTYLYNNYTRVE